jgi:hypothetical protein
MKSSKLTAFVFSVVSFTAIAQEEQKPALQFSAYAEVYYAYDFNNPSNNQRPGFMYSFNRHNEINLNMGYLKAFYQQEKLRASLALMAGTYTNANLAAEPGVLQNLFEAYAGVKISSKKNLWIDAGIFGSHIGFESAIGKDCWNLTRGILAENSPYYEAGAKITYNSDNEKWMLSGLLLNGWQRIQRVEGNSLPSFGTQLQYKPSDKVLLNYSTFIGTDKPDSARLMRYFNNFYGIFTLSDLVGLTLGLDAGWEQADKGSSQMNNWFTPIIVAEFTTSAKTSLALRAEYYQDANGVIIATGTPNGFKTWGFSANFDVNILPNAVWRIEARQFASKDEIFVKGSTGMVDASTAITTSLAVSF